MSTFSRICYPKTVSSGPFGTFTLENRAQHDVYDVFAMLHAKEQAHAPEYLSKEYILDFLQTTLSWRYYIRRPVVHCYILNRAIYEFLADRGILCDKIDEAKSPHFVALISCEIWQGDEFKDDKRNALENFRRLMSCPTPLSSDSLQPRINPPRYTRSDPSIRLGPSQKLSNTVCVQHTPNRAQEVTSSISPKADASIPSTTAHDLSTSYQASNIEARKKATISMTPVSTPLPKPGPDIGPPIIADEVKLLGHAPHNTPSKKSPDISVPAIGTNLLKNGPNVQPPPAPNISAKATSTGLPKTAPEIKPETPTHYRRSPNSIPNISEPGTVTDLLTTGPDIQVPVIAHDLTASMPAPYLSPSRKAPDKKSTLPYPRGKRDYPLRPESFERSESHTQRFIRTICGLQHFGDYWQETMMRILSDNRISEQISVDQAFIVRRKCECECQHDA